MDETCPLCTGGRGRGGWGENPAPCRGTLGHSASSVSTITCCTRWKTALSSIPASARYLRQESHHTASCGFKQLHAASCSFRQLQGGLWAGVHLRRRESVHLHPVPTPSLWRQSEGENLRGGGGARGAACPVSTEGGTRHVQSVREGGGGGLRGAKPSATAVGKTHSAWHGSAHRTVCSVFGRGFAGGTRGRAHLLMDELVRWAYRLEIEPSSYEYFSVAKRTCEQKAPPLEDQRRSHPLALRHYGHRGAGQRKARCTEAQFAQCES